MATEQQINQLIASMQENTDIIRRFTDGMSGSGSGGNGQPRRPMTGDKFDDMLGKHTDKLRSSTGAADQFNRALSGTASNLNGTLQNLNRSVDSASNSLVRGSTGIAEAMDLVSSAGGAIVSPFKALVDVSRDNAEVGERNTKNLSMSNKALLTFSTSLKSIGVLFGVAATAISFFAGFLQGTYAQFSEVSQGAAAFGSELVTLRRTSDEAGIGMQEFTSWVRSSSSQLAQLGGTASQGAMAVAGISKAIRDGGLQSTFYALGITGQEQLEVVGEYMALMQRAGQSRLGQDALIAQQSTRYAKSLRQLAELTGQSVEEARRAADQTTSNAAFEAWASEIGRTPEEIANARNMIGLVTTQMGAEAGELLQNFISEGQPMNAAMASLSAVIPGLGAVFNDVAGDMRSMNPDEFMVRFAQSLGNNAGQIGADFRAAGDLMRATMTDASGDIIDMMRNIGPGFGNFTRFANMLRENGGDIEAALESLGQGDSAMQGAATMQETMQSLVNSFQRLQTEVFDKIFGSSGMDSIVSMMEGFRESLDGLDPAKIGENIGTFASALGGIVMWMVENPWPTAIATGLIAGVSMLGNFFMGAAFMRMMGGIRAATSMGGAAQTGLSVMQGAQAGGGGLLGRLTGGAGRLLSGAGRLLRAGGPLGLLGLGLEGARSFTEEGSATDTALGIGASTATGASIGAMVGSIVPGLGTAIGGAIGGGIGAIWGLVENWDNIDIAGMTAAVAEGARAVWDGVVNMWDGTISALGTAANTVGEWAMAAWDGYTSILGSAVDAISSAASTVGEWAMAAWDGYVGLLHSGIDAIGSAASTVGEWAVAAWDGYTNTLGSAFDAIGSAANTVGEWASEQWNNLLGVFGEVFSALAGGALELGGAVIDRVSDVGETVVDAANTMVDGVGHLLSDLSDWWEGDEEAPTTDTTALTAEGSGTPMGEDSTTILDALNRQNSLLEQLLRRAVESIDVQEAIRNNI